MTRDTGMVASAFCTGFGTALMLVYLAAHLVMWKILRNPTRKP